MRINTTQVLKNYEGKEILEDDKPITLRDVFSIGLNSQLPDEKMTADQKAKIFQITTKLYTNNEVDLTVDQLALIKEQVGKVYNPLVYGRVCEIIDGTQEVVDK